MYLIENSQRYYGSYSVLLLICDSNLFPVLFLFYFLIAWIYRRILLFWPVPWRFASQRPVHHMLQDIQIFLTVVLKSLKSSHYNTYFVFYRIKESCILLNLSKGSALLLRDTLRSCLTDDEVEGLQEEEVLSEIGVHRLDAKKSIDVLNLRTDLTHI